MPTYLKGDIFSAFGETNLLCIPTGTILQNDGRLTMQGGFAEAALARIPGLDLRLGAEVERTRTDTDQYGLVVVESAHLVPDNSPAPLIAGLQTKTHRQRSASYDLLALSLRKLGAWISRNRPRRVDMPWPGIGYQGLDPKQVRPLLAGFPCYVHVWRLPKP